MKKIKIGQRFIGEGEPLYFIADIAANHDGNLNRAFKLIELAKESGADVAKFQNFQAPKIISRKGFESLGKRLAHQSAWKKSVYEVYQDASIPFEWAQKLKQKCEGVGIEYCSSSYDFESVDLIEPFVNFFKIGSGDITWLQELEYIAKKGKPIMLATGASTLDDIFRAVNMLRSITNDIVLMQCNTNYTINPENYKYINLNVLKSYRNYFPYIILGLSDHTPGHATVLGAVALGAVVFEKHFTDDNTREGPDHRFAMNPKTFKEMVCRANELYQALGDGEKRIEDNEKETFYLQRRGLRFTKNLTKGHIIQSGDLFPLRPLAKDGIPPFEIKKIIGKKLIRDVSADDYVRWEAFK